MKSELYAAIAQIAAERGIPAEVIIESLEAALLSAYKRQVGDNVNATVKIEPKDMLGARVFAHKLVVEGPTEDINQMPLDTARKLKASAAVGDTIDVESTPNDFGRIAAQTAKQVVLQRIREAERDQVYSEYYDRVGDIINGTVQRQEQHALVLELGKAEAILPEGEQVKSERYRLGQRLKVYLVEVQKSHRGPALVVSRTHRNLLRRLFELEVPEIFNGTVEIKSIAREPGTRSKVAVAARQEGVDPVGSCVGMRGIRIQNIVNELYGEKIDVVQWSEDHASFIANALSPAQVVSVDLNEEDKTATVIVPERQLSLAIGKEGQNARLAAKLTGWRIDIKSASAGIREEEDDFARRAREALGGASLSEVSFSDMSIPDFSAAAAQADQRRTVREDNTIIYQGNAYGPLEGEELAGEHVYLSEREGNLRVRTASRLLGSFPLLPPNPEASDDEEE